MTELVVGDDPPFQRIEQAVALLQTRDDSFDRRREVGHRDRLGMAPGREQCRLVDQIRQVRAGEAGRQRRDLLGLHVVPELCHLLQMYRQDLLASPFVGPVDQDLPVEPPGTQQRRIEDFGPVCGGE